MERGTIQELRRALIRETIAIFFGDGTIATQARLQERIRRIKERKAQGPRAKRARDGRRRTGRSVRGEDCSR